MTRLGSAAAGTAAVLHKALAPFRSQAELELRLGQQQAVARLGQLALTDATRQELLDAACREVVAELHTDLAGVLELLPDRSAFVLRAAVGWRPQEQVGVQHIPAGPRSQGGYTLTSQRPVILRDAARETRFGLSPQMSEQGITSGLSTRIGSNCGVYGVLGAHTVRRRDFSEHDLTFVEAVAGLLASALGRRAAEAEAEKTHRVLEAVIEGTTDDVFVKDTDGRFIAINEKAAQTLGRPRDELIGHLLHEVVPQEVADMMAETDRLILEQGTVETFEEVVSAGGRTRVLLTTKGPYHAGDGTLLGTFGIARDITARKAQEEQLARSEERFRLAQEGARMGTWDVDLVTGVSTWSDGLRTIYDVGPDHQSGVAGLESLLHPDDRERVMRDATVAIENGTDYEFEYRIVRQDGEVRWLMARSTMLVEGGTSVRQLGVVVDITERKLTEDDLLRSEETLRLAQVYARLGVWEWDIESDELTWSPTMYEMFGVDPTASKPTYDVMSANLHPDDLITVNLEVQRVFASSESFYEVLSRAVRPSGEIRWLISRGTVIRSDDGSPVRVLGVTLDETDRKRIAVEREQLEGRLRQAERLEALGQLAGGVAHDFNNLLLAIRGYGELALGRLEREEVGVQDEIDGILAAADRAAALTKQLLAFGRRQVLNPDVLDLNDVVRKTSGLLQRLIGDNVELVTTFADQPVIVRADRGQLEQVITNLAVNARDAMPGGGALTICVTTAEVGRRHGAGPRHALLSVADEGSGIDAATAALIFEPFFTTKGEEGTGLGLATVYGIVAQSG
ncbi:MAG: hypothetical protein QOH95_2293, partial [Gaiellaceae bacterium]|nr:hypothetical protein [Gaiellaceae bacterium]